MAADPLTRSTVDDLFNTDFSDFDDDTFADKPTITDTRDDKAVLSPRSGLKRKSVNDKENDGLGLDEEVKIAKKRKPVAKLDEARLLSEPGLPKLRAVARSGQLTKRLRIKGKGHEFTDAARLLNHFQLWLDNLYPRAKFADALQLVEKAGHTKRMQIARNEWMNEGKPGYRKYDDVQASEEQQNEPNLFGAELGEKRTERSTSSSNAVDEAARPSTSMFGTGFDDDALFIPDVNRPSQIDRDDEPDDDELDALLASAQNDETNVSRNPRQNQTAYESEGEDDLDALLAEQDSRQNRQPPSRDIRPTSEHDEEQDDDLDALLAEQEVQKPASSTERAEQSSPTTRNVQNVLLIESSDDDEEDDLEALLAMQRTKSKPASNDPEPSLPTPQHTSSPAKAPNSSPPQSPHRDTSGLSGIRTTMFSSSPVPNNPEEMDLDDLDALLASQEAKENARARAQSDNDDDDGHVQMTPRANKVRAAEDNLLSSSPVPNEDSQ